MQRILPESGLDIGSSGADAMKEGDGKERRWGTYLEFLVLIALIALPLLFVVYAFVAAPSANAHPGGLAADGCHNDKKNGGRHCHRGPNAGDVITPPSDGRVYYPNCSAARRAGAAPIYRGQPGYGSHLDRDGDGKACE